MVVKRLVTAAVMALVAGVLVGAPVQPASAGPVEPGFRIDTVLSGLVLPTVVRFAPDGRIFVAEKRGTVQVFDGLSDPSPDMLVDLSSAVYDWWDRGLLGMAVDPAFPASPYVYVLYSTDTKPYGDVCPDPPGANRDGCMGDARLSRLRVGPDNRLVGAEQVLIGGNWCIQYPTHTIGTLEFGPDGALYVSAGDGAGYLSADYGQGGGSFGSPTPMNPCGDPPVPVGFPQIAWIAQGGALRSQDLRTSGDPVTFDGTILRVNPATGAALPNNPLIGGDSGDDRIVAYGLRNPFRFTVRPGTTELWMGDVGMNDWEELDRIINPVSGVPNFGWPCYEGGGRQPVYDALDNGICENLYRQTGAVSSPYWSYHHGEVVAGCPGGTSSVSGVAFYQDGSYPDAFDGALFFADYSRGCIWAMLPGANGVPDPANIRLIADGTLAVDLKAGPGGDIFYSDILTGTINRIRFVPNTSPNAVFTASPTSGPAPLRVNFDASGSSDPNGDPITFAWDLDGDGQFDDSTAVKPSFTYSQAGAYTVSLRVSDDRGGSDTAQRQISVSPNAAPVATIVSPAAQTTWAVGSTISFSGTGTDAEDGAIPASRFSWSLALLHCALDNPNSCHQHSIQTFNGTKSGQFKAPDHDYPSRLLLALTVTDSAGKTATTQVELAPRTVQLTFASNPPGVQLVVGTTPGITPFARTVIVGSANAVNAPSQWRNGRLYLFLSWSDGGAQMHTITAPSAPTTYTANFLRL